MTVTWTKSWSSSDDGSVLSGNDIGTIQTNIDTYCGTFAGTQEFTGNKTFSGGVTMTGDVTIGTTEISSELVYLDNVASNIAGANETVVYEGAVVTYDNNVVYYR